MSFNIAGIVINKNFENNNREELYNFYNNSINFEKEIDFKTASENHKEEGIIDVYFSEKGTLIFTNSDYCLDGYIHPNTNILTFVLSETSMSFSFFYSENQKFVRSKMEVNGTVLSKNGKKLQIENETNDISEVIWKQIEVILGKPFFDIKPEEKAYRFSERNFSVSPEEQKILELNEAERRLEVTDSWKLLDEFSNECIEKINSWNKIDAERLMSEYDKFMDNVSNKELIIANYQDFIDIYFLKKQSLFGRRFKDEIIFHIIELSGFYFRSNALEYLDKFAFVNRAEQQSALKLLLLQVQFNRRKEETFRKIRQNFNSFNEETKSFVIQQCSNLFPNEKIDFNSKSSFNNSKKWWEFWK